MWMVKICTLMSSVQTPITQTCGEYPYVLSLRLYLCVTCFASFLYHCISSPYGLEFAKLLWIHLQSRLPCGLVGT